MMNHAVAIIDKTITSLPKFRKMVTENKGQRKNIDTMEN